MADLAEVLRRGAADAEFAKNYGAYGESERATFRPKLRKATMLECRRLSSQPEYTYYVPFLPLAVCPAVPDVAAEYCLAYGKDLELVHWKIDRPLIPSLGKVSIDTSNVFGIAGSDGPKFINFANGILLQDEGQQLIYRMWTQAVDLIEPSVTLSRPAERILADQFRLHVFCLQSEKAAWYVRPAVPPVELEVVRSNQGDIGLAEVGRRFWRRGRRTDIIQKFN